MFRLFKRPFPRVRLLLSLAALAALFVAAPHTMTPQSTTLSLSAPDGVDPGWWAQVSGELRTREYHAGPLGDGWQAPNRRHDLRTVFRSEGITVTPRGSTPGWFWHWSLASWGRDHQSVAAPVAPAAEDATVRYARNGLTEWYENREDGLEQGFELASAPAGTGELRLVGRVKTDLRARVSPDRGVTFLDDDGYPVLDYAELHVWDAAERELPSRMEWDDGSLVLAIDDLGAVYPVTIDPIVTTPTWTEEGDKFAAEFGWSVATAGDVNGDGYSDIIVGSPGYSETGYIVNGRSWVSLGSASGLATSPAWWDEGDGDEAEFGYDVACTGDVNGDGYDDIVVGSPGWTDDLAQDGRAYVYHGSASGPSTSPDWADNDGSYNSYRYGQSVSTAGDVNGDGYDDVVFGDPWAPAVSGYGSLNVWYGSATGLGYNPDWIMIGPVDSRHLGVSVSTAGDIDGDGYDDIVAGARYADGDGWERGAIYVFTGSASGLPASYDQYIPADIDYLHMGETVSLAGDVNGDGYADVLVGCPTDNDHCVEDSHVRLYAGSATGLETTPAWSYGIGVAVAGTRIGCAGDVNGDGYADFLIGSSGYDTGSGRIDLFYGDWTGPTTYPNWTAYGDQSGAHLGHSVATAGDVNGDGFSDVIAGSPHYDGPSILCGRVSCWMGAPEGLRRMVGWAADSAQTGALVGYSVASAGDANGDGYDDLLVGAPYYDSGQADEGVMFLFLGSNQGPSISPAWWAESNQAAAHLGYAVSSAGDVNGDGLCDLIVGAPNYRGGTDGEGVVLVWYSVLGGGPYGNPGNADWRDYSKQLDAHMGRSVACAGDVNGDGYADVAVGIPDYDTGHVDEGAVWVFHGSNDGLSITPDWTREASRTDAHFGRSVASAGDMNGDGFSDLIVGSPGYDHPSDWEGLVFVYDGSATGLTTGAPWWWAQSDQAGAQLGYSVSCAGDVNGDGYSDVVVGAPYFDDDWDDQGLVLVWYGAATAPPAGLVSNADWRSDYEAPTANHGGAVACAGDVNADGYSDIVVGSPGVNFSGYVDSGMAELFEGSATGLGDSYSDWFDGGLHASALYGYSVTGGDFNGDGFGDVVIGAPGHSSGYTNEGRTRIYWGGNGRGLARTPRMWQHDQTTRLAPLGRTSVGTEFCVGARGRTPAGRGDVRLEIEIEEFGTPFDGAGLVLGDWADTGAPSGLPGSVVDLVEPVDGLTIDTAYHWRMRLVRTNPYFPSSPWLGLSWNCLTEMDLRTGSAASGVHDTPDAPAAALAAVPNPFNPTTTFSYVLTGGEHVRLQIFDARGRLVRNLVDTHQDAGPRTAVWDGHDDAGRGLASGVYLARLWTGGATRLIKVTLMK